MAEKKLKLYKQTAYNILELNKQAVRSDYKKTYVQEQRGFYNVVSVIQLRGVFCFESRYNSWLFFCDYVMIRVIDIL